MAEEQDLKWAVQNGDLEKVQSIIGNVSNNSNTIVRFATSIHKVENLDKPTNQQSRTCTH